MIINKNYNELGALFGEMMYIASKNVNNKDIANILKAEMNKAGIRDYPMMGKDIHKILQTVI